MLKTSPVGLVFLFVDSIRSLRMRVSHGPGFSERLPYFHSGK